MKDSFGQEVKVGQTVLYATRSGSSQNLKLAWVLEIKGDKANVRVVAENGYSDFSTGKWHGGYTKDGTYVSEVSVEDPSYTTLITGVNCIVLGEFDVQPIRRMQRDQRLEAKAAREVQNRGE